MNQDSLAHLEADEARALVVALVRRLGGTVEFTDREIDAAQQERPDVRILKDEAPGPHGRRFTVDLVQTIHVTNDTNTGS